MTETMTRLKQDMGAKEAQDYGEGTLARNVEAQTAKLPSDVWLWAAFGSIGASLFLRMMGKKEESTFVGHWAAPFMLLGDYNKLVKLHGSDRVP